MWSSTTARSAGAPRSLYLHRLHGALSEWQGHFIPDSIIKCYLTFVQGIQRLSQHLP
jgi:hypothetical protein